MAPPCGGPNENETLRLIHLNAWFKGGGTVWKGPRGVALPEEVCHRALSFQKTHLSQSALSVTPRFSCKLSGAWSQAQCLPAAMLLTMVVMDGRGLML